MKRLLLLIIALTTTCLVWAARAQELKIKGFHIDLRIQVMTPQALNEFASELATMGINTIVMEWEASYPYKKHAVISNEYVYTETQVKSFVAHCKSLGIAVIPLQHCFGHVEYILRHDRYTPMREAARLDISQICPLNPSSAPLFKELFAEINEHNTSDYIHIGGDETYLLGACPKCKEYVQTEGKSKLFVQYIKTMCEYVTALGKRPIIWADIITKYPEAVGELPSEAILVDWNYGWKVRHFGNIDKIYESGIEMWGAPAIRSSPDSHFLTSWKKHFDNQRDFIPYAREAGYKGFIMTSWSTSGVYGYTWGANNEVENMEAIRNLYPMSGFRILVACYAQALENSEAIDPITFVQKYAVERFGLTDAQGEILWDVLSSDQLPLQRGLDAANNDAQAQRKANDECMIKLAQMKPRRNIKEFDHLRLMFSLRDTYLDFKVIEAQMQSPNFRREGASELLTQLNRVINQSHKDDRRYTRMNSGYISDKEIAHQNYVRVRKMLIMRDRLEALCRK